MSLIKEIKFDSICFKHPLYLDNKKIYQDHGTCLRCEIEHEQLMLSLHLEEDAAIEKCNIHSKHKNGKLTEKQVTYITLSGKYGTTRVLRLCTKCFNTSCYNFRNAYVPLLRKDYNFYLHLARTWNKKNKSGFEIELAEIHPEVIKLHKALLDVKKVLCAHKKRKENE